MQKTCSGISRSNKIINEFIYSTYVYRRPILHQALFKVLEYNSLKKINKQNSLMSPPPWPFSMRKDRQ